MNNDMPSPMDDLPEAMLEEAAVWQARLRDSEPGTPADRKQRAAFNQWLLKDVRHRQAYAQMESLWDALAEPVEQVIAKDAISRTASGRRFFGQGKGLALAASLVLAMFFAIGWQYDWMLRWQSDHMTAVGEAAPIALEDGSRIVLNTNSAVVKDYSEQARRVRLLKGEAWFDIVPDDNRPFIVTTEAGAVQVTGTQFNVRMEKEAAIVSLAQGSVELRVPQSPEYGPVVLMPGQQATMLGDHISDPVSFDRTAVTAWLRGQFVFYNTPLAQVVETLNRYRRGHIVIVNEALNELAVSGIFRTDDPDAALEVMTNTLPIRQTRLTDYVVLIR
mgnify:CR=1 FL=1|tara:strand:+ start:24956 stop:25951 length:996 start_codon:yes stop_codon:yes gene_type:complete